MLTTTAAGDNSRIDEMRGNEVKGNLVLSRRWYLAERAGPTAMKNVLNALDPRARALLENTVMPFSWVPFGPLIDIDLAIIDEVMGGQIERMREFGSELGHRDVGGIYRAFLALPSKEFVLGKLSALGSMYFRESTLGFTSRGPGEGAVHLVGRCMPRYMCGFGISGWLHAVLTCAKARGVSVAHGTCVHTGAPNCRWDLRWEPSAARPRRVVEEEE